MASTSLHPVERDPSLQFELRGPLGLWSLVLGLGIVDLISGALLITGLPAMGLGFDLFLRGGEVFFYALRVSGAVLALFAALAVFRVERGPVRPVPPRIRRLLLAVFALGIAAVATRSPVWFGVTGEALVEPMRTVWEVILPLEALAAAVVLLHLLRLAAVLASPRVLRAMRVVLLFFVLLKIGSAALARLQFSLRFDHGDLGQSLAGVSIVVGWCLLLTMLALTRMLLRLRIRTEPSAISAASA